MQRLTKMEKPLLSVLMSNYNYGKYIAQAINGILEQEYSPLEFIIVDDASTDNSVEVIRKCIEHRTDVKFIQNVKNKGLLSFVNESIDLAKGEYLFWFSSDDILKPLYFQKAMKILIDNPHLGLCCSNASIMMNDRIVKKNVIEKYFKDGATCIFSPEDLIAIIKKTFFGILPGTICKKSAVLEAKGFNIQLDYMCDWYMHNKISFKHGIAYIHEPFVIFRRHELNFSGKNSHEKQEKIKLYLLDLLDKEDLAFVKSVKKSRVLIQANILALLVKTPKYWNLLFPLLIKKSKNICKKLPGYLKNKISDIFKVSHF